MEGPRALFGLVLVVVGAVGGRYAHVVAKWSEQWDAIGSRRNREEIEPTTWKTTFVLLDALVVLLVGLYLLVTAFL